jgi:starch synthase
MTSRPVEVALGSPNRHWTFDLGRELRERGLLKRLYTMYPKGRVEEVPAPTIRSFPFVLGASVALARLGLGTQGGREPLVIDTYDRWLSRAVEECTVFHCVSSFGLRTHRRVKRDFGALTVCDRGCGHIAFQDRVLTEERELWGFPGKPIHPSVVARELQEYEECDIVTVPSPFARRTFVDEGVPEDKLRCVPFAADLSMFSPKPREDGVFRVMYAGALTLQKGVPYLLRAVGDLDLPNFELVLVGSPTDEGERILERFKGRYRYLGHKPRAELAWHYSQASVLVLPSIQDGFGMVMAQAMACRVPVVASVNTGVDALFADGEAGYHVPIRDSDAIREAVLRLYEDPELQDHLAAAALERVRSFGGWRAYGDAMAEVYRTGVEARR